MPVINRRWAYSIRISRVNRIWRSWVIDDGHT